ncbi:diguanylate cyclase [Pseudomonas sp. A-1]|uniref:diguanylate cyclase domain-containing protein n=1 Tax=Pseudomonas sp. A-1 TaxID=1821274 RepID=UPI0010A5F7C9|nr:diguanylate cyclase [Pseudomonas sp. A-1]THG83323.1 diguanylate cyclase [Pseudomonas sp. A-1]
MNNGNHPTLVKIVDLLMDAICVVDVEGRFLAVSAACERIFGYRPEELIGRPMIELVADEDRVRTLQAAREIMAGEPKLNFENRYRRKDGRYADIQWSACWLESDGVRIAVARDVSARRRAERLQAALYAISEAAHAASDLLALFEQIRRIIGELLPVRGFFVALRDERGERLTLAYPSSAESAAAVELCAQIVRSRQALLQAGVQPDDGCWLGVPLDCQQGVIGALLLESPAGGAGYGEQERELLQFVSAQVATAIERKRLYARLAHAAQHDALTGLANRELLSERLQGALARARRSGQLLALLYLDLDDFKRVNDTLGHAAGDRLLQETARRLLQTVRASDTVARIGGDEFVVLLEGILHAEQAPQVAEKIRAALGRPLELAGGAPCMLPSIGIALYPGDGESEFELLRQADAAMYVAKQQRAAQRAAALGAAAPGRTAGESAGG